MEHNKVELEQVELVAKQADVAIRELADLELALVGGGVGDVEF